VLARMRDMAAGKHPDRLGGLSEQERRILSLIAEGKTNREIAATVYLAEKTVKNYVSTILSKLGMERRAQAAAYLAEQRARGHE
jgi:two-component system, NarL family, response regulator DevR